MSSDSSKNEQIRQKCLKCLKNLNANFYIGGNNRERIFYQSKITQKDSKILLSFTKDAKETKLHVYKKCT